MAGGCFRRRHVAGEPRGPHPVIVGPNGAGKSTADSIILGTESADAGEVIQERNVSFGYLPQESAPAGDESVVELATAITPEFIKLRRIIKAWEADHPVEAQHAEDIHDNVHDRFNELGGYRLEAKAKQILAGLGFREKDFDRPAREMSGGWVMRAHLARLLTLEPDLLLLDEPTNHLDLEALIWFQDYLKSYPGAILVISHDREFLNQLVGGIVEIRQSKLVRYRGNYDEYLVQREASEVQLLAAYKNQQREIAHMMDFVNRFRAKNTKAAQAQSKLKQIERMDKIEAPTNDDSKIGFRFPQPQRGGQKAITLENIHQAYGEEYSAVYRGTGLQGRARPTHRAGRSKRRRQIHHAEDSCRRSGPAKRNAHARPQRQVRVLFAISRRDAGPAAHGFRGGTGYAATGDGTVRPHPAGQLSVPRR